MESYSPDKLYIDNATHEDTPLKSDGRGPRITGIVRKVIGHQVPGEYEAFGGYMQRSPLIPGVLLSNVSVEGRSGEDEEIVFVPFLFASEPEVADLPVEV